MRSDKKFYSSAAVENFSFLSFKIFDKFLKSISLNILNILHLWIKNLKKIYRYKVSLCVMEGNRDHNGCNKIFMAGCKRESEEATDKTWSNYLID